MTTKRYKPNRKPSGLARHPLRGKCKTSDGWREQHRPVNQPHPSIPSITRTVCADCATVLDWISIEERAKREDARR